MTALRCDMFTTVGNYIAPLDSFIAWCGDVTLELCFDPRLADAISLIFFSLRVLKQKTDNPNGGRLLVVYTPAEISPARAWGKDLILSFSLLTEEMHNRSGMVVRQIKAFRTRFLNLKIIKN